MGVDAGMGEQDWSSFHELARKKAGLASFAAPIFKVTVISQTGASLVTSTVHRDAEIRRVQKIKNHYMLERFCLCNKTSRMLITKGELA